MTTPFGPATRAWLDATFAVPTSVQDQGWRSIASGKHSLLLAPTGSGKTLAGFLWAIDRCATVTTSPDTSADANPVAMADDVPGVRVLYVSPLKALAYDVERNLRAPLAGIEQAAARLGVPIRRPRVAIRTGDTSPQDRRAHQRHPSEIMVTTPESLYLMLGSQVRETFRTVHTVIIDEIHALAPTKRGVHLALTLERLAVLANDDPQRIGLSATARPPSVVAGFLGGDREVEIIDTSRPPQIELNVVVPAEDMENLDLSVSAVDVDADVEGEESLRLSDSASSDPSLSVIAREMEGGAARPGLWPSVHVRLLEEIERHRSTIVFVNSRGLCERLAQRLNEIAVARDRAARGLDWGEEAVDDDEAESIPDLVRTHHGSVAPEQRKETEEALKAGTIRAIVATSSLELGIDMAAVDHVVMVQSPGSVASGLQRIGRAGHQVGETSRGTLIPKHRADLLESTVVVRHMHDGAIEALRLPQRPLDILAQQIVAMVAVETWTLERLEELVRRAAPYRDLGRELFVAVLDMLAGRYPSHDFGELRPRIVWDRATDELSARRGAKTLAITSGGTIPDRGTYAVHLGSDGPRVGELDEEMVYETRPGHVIALGASSWRVMEITRDRVVVDPAPGEPARLPFWRGDGPGRPIELGRALGAFVRELDERREQSTEDATTWLRESWSLDENAAGNLVGYVREQREATGSVPSDTSITIERFRDELGDWRVCLHSPFGSRVHAPWALAIENRLAESFGFEIQALSTDDGIMVRLAEGDEFPDLDLLLPEPEEVEDFIVEQLGHSALFAGVFRENAARALLLPRRRPGQRTPLWVQRLKSQNLLAVARRFPSFPIMLETYRTCLHDVFDVPMLVDLLRKIRAREVRVDEVETTQPSPFARSLVFWFTANYLYEGDAPLAERRAQALALDRGLLRELLGHEELRELLDGDVIDEVEAELQRRAVAWRARHVDGLHDVLRWVGDLTEAEIVERTTATASERTTPPTDTDATGAATAWRAELGAAKRVVPVRVAGEERWVAVEDVALYRDALETVLPPGLPATWLEPVDRPVEELLCRYAKSHGPFAAGEAARRFGLGVGVVDEYLLDLERRGLVVAGEFRPGGAGKEWCDPDVLRQIRQRTLAKLRREVAAVDGTTYARFLLAWHGATSPGGGLGRLGEAIDRFEGLPIALDDFESAMLPVRVADYDGRLLDDLLATGEVVWVGEAPLGLRGGRVVFYRRENVASLREPPAIPDDTSTTARDLLEFLERRGACFFAEMWSGMRDHRREDLEEALWDLVWAGLVTNDTLAPLRERSTRRRTRTTGRASTSRRAARSRRPTRAPGGRWSLVANLHFDDVAATARVHARSLMLLERHGIVGRPGLEAETLPGGFAAVYPVLRAMEEAGKIRRGYFVEDLGGSQFAFPGAVDRLRAARVVPETSEAVCLAAQDPANPFGACLAWPDPIAPDETLTRRAAGARVVIVDGELALYVTKNGRKIGTFPIMEDVTRARLAIETLRESRRGPALHSFRIEIIDGESAHRCAWTDAFCGGGFVADYRGLTI